jgi:hypothetical protein
VKVLRVIVMRNDRREGSMVRRRSNDFYNKICQERPHAPQQTLLDHLVGAGEQSQGNGRKRVVTGAKAQVE